MPPWTRRTKVHVTVSTAGRLTGERSGPLLGRAGPTCPPTIQLLFRPRGVISMRGPRPGRPHSWPGLDQERRMSRLHASLEVKAMKTRNAWLALVVLLAVHGSARSDFIATATLTGDGESPSTGTGYGTVTFNAAAQTLTVLLTFSDLNLPAGETSGSYATMLTAANLSTPLPDSITSFADAVSAIEAGQTYFNIHTVAFPGGEIRGQITVVPEPASLTLLTLGLGGILAIAQFGRRLAA